MSSISKLLSIDMDNDSKSKLRSRKREWMRKYYSTETGKANVKNSHKKYYEKNKETIKPKMRAYSKIRYDREKEQQRVARLKRYYDSINKAYPEKLIKRISELQ